MLKKTIIREELQNLADNDTPSNFTINKQQGAPIESSNVDDSSATMVPAKENSNLTSNVDSVYSFLCG